MSEDYKKRSSAKTRARRSRAAGLAKRKAAHQPPAPALKEPRPKNRIPRELPGLICVFLAVITVLALISHSPADPSPFNGHQPWGEAEVQNSIGLFGAYYSALLIKAFGLAAFWPVLVLALLALACFASPRHRPNPYLLGAGLALLVFSAASMAALIWPRLTFAWPGTPGGGRFGELLALASGRLFGRLGGLLLSALLGLCGFLLATSFTFGGFFSQLKALGRELKAIARGGEAEPQLEKDRAAALPGPPEPADDPGPEKRPSGPPDGAAGSSPPPIAKEKAPIKITAGQRFRGGKAVPEKAVAKPDLEAALSRVLAERRPGEPYKLPPDELLDDPPEKAADGSASGLSAAELMVNARRLERKLLDFGVEGRVTEVCGGPVITMYEYQPAPGVKISKIAGLADDLAMAMRATAIRVVAPLPGKPAIGIEIPNPKRQMVSLSEVIQSEAFQKAASPLSLVMGVDIVGEPVISDLAKMPHLLIAGATGSGKSVGLGAMIMSILFKASPEQVRFLMIDPKRIELTLYQDLPHLIYPVLSDPTEATTALKWAVAEMERRYKLLAEKGARNIETYNQKVWAEGRKQAPGPLGGEAGSASGPPGELPLLVIIIDELADLMMVAAKDVETYIMRLAQMARAAGMHLILATQRPSVDVLTGLIKANLPTRVSFQVSSKIDSRTILDQMGAEKLLGAGDMLFMPPGVAKLRRLHGAFVSEAEIKRVTDFIKAWGPPNYLEELIPPDQDETGAGAGDDDRDEKYQEAVQLVLKTGKASISHVQRHLRIGYNRAARIVEDMEREGLVSQSDGIKPRQVVGRMD